MKHNLKFICILFTLAILFFLHSSPALADISPPETPPGSNLEPGAENTQVRMVSEIVTLVINEKPPSGSLGQAAVTASFQMQNTGTQEENMEVRFPLTFASGRNDGFGTPPEIKDIRVKVNGASVSTTRITTENPSNSSDFPIPWAAFEIVFPPAEPVVVEVKYTQEGWGEYPYVVFRYLLETGAGWFGTIGSADLIVKLPYEANRQNTIFDMTIGFGESDPGAVISGNELRWHYEDFEPEWKHNFDVALVMPEAWNKILLERENTTRAPGDGESWGRLGKALKEASRLRRGYREDEGGLQIYQEAVAAYDKSVTLLPKDALWHYGFADLLWNHYYFHGYSFAKEAHDQTELLRTLEELRLSLELDPDNDRTLEMLEEIAGSIPEAVEMEGTEYKLLALTATPDYPTPFPTIFIPDYTETPEPTATAQPAPTQTDDVEQVVITEEQEPNQPPQEPAPTSISSAPQTEERKGITICGAAFLPLLALLAPSLRRSRYKT